MYFINSLCEVKTFIREDQSRWISFLDLSTYETIQLRFPRGLSPSQTGKIYVRVEENDIT